jgi:hypothetical protein
MDPKVKIVLLTRTLITDFASGASDLDAVITLASRGVTVLSLANLHAKVYVVDKKRALVTSANATFSGMSRNVECGLTTESATDATLLAEMIQMGFGAKVSPQRWLSSDLEALKPSVEALRQAMPQLPRSYSGTDENVFLELNAPDYSSLTESLPGWLSLVWKGISSLGRSSFNMQDVVRACTPLINERFPANRHPREKMRQQMQRLRDMGVVIFLGNGRYELAIRLKD